MTSVSSKEALRDFIVDKWLPALRSGEYKQLQGALRKGDEFCCLGVACDLIDRDKWDGYAILQSWGDVLPTNVPRDVFPLHCFPMQLSVLSELNDEGYSFDKIADFIEEECLPLLEY